MRKFMSHDFPTKSSALSKFTTSFGVFFKVPDQGMTEYNILARCTATPVKPSTANGPLRFLVAAHTARPWAFPHFYPKPWLLEFVNERHVRYVAELREPSTGKVVVSYELGRPTYHPTRDVAALRLVDETQALDDIQSKGLPFSPLALRSSVLGAGDAVDVVGYEVVEGQNQRIPPRLISSDKDEGTGDSGNDDDRRPGKDDHDDPLRGLRDRADPTMLFSQSRGFLVARTQHQTFVKTDSVLNSGMCGGAVLDSSLECCGCVEGVVPIAPPDANITSDVRSLQGTACMVESTEISDFLRDDDLFNI